jgi:hypothetical protein
MRGRKGNTFIVSLSLFLSFSRATEEEEKVFLFYCTRGAVNKAKLSAHST